MSELGDLALQRWRVDPAPLESPADKDAQQRLAIRRELETPRELEREIDWLEVLVMVWMESLFQGGGGPSIELPPIPQPPPLPAADAMAREPTAPGASWRLSWQTNPWPAWP